MHCNTKWPHLVTWGHNIDILSPNKVDMAIVSRNCLFTLPADRE